MIFAPFDLQGSRHRPSGDIIFFSYTNPTKYAVFSTFKSLRIGRAKYDEGRSVFVRVIVDAKRSPSPVRVVAEEIHRRDILGVAHARGFASSKGSDLVGARCIVDRTTPDDVVLAPKRAAIGDISAVEESAMFVVAFFFPMRSCERVLCACVPPVRRRLGISFDRLRRRKTLLLLRRPPAVRTISQRRHRCGTHRFWRFDATAT